MQTPTKLLSEMLAMIDDMPSSAAAADDSRGAQNQSAPQMTHAIRPILISGGNVIVLYSTGSVVIHGQGSPEQVAADAGKTPHR